MAHPMGPNLDPARIDRQRSAGNGLPNSSCGNIYDQNGNPIAQQSDAHSIGVIPSQLGKAAGTVDVELGRLMGIQNFDDIHSLWENQPADFYVGMTQASPDEIQKAQLDLTLPGLVTSKYTSRFYFDQGIAPQVVGYTQLISPDQLNAYRRLGYRGDEKTHRPGWHRKIHGAISGWQTWRHALRHRFERRARHQGWL